MKNKIFKLLSVVMALAMIFSTFVCVAHAEEANTVAPVLVQGTVDGNTGEIMGHVTTRLSTEELIPVANYEKVTIAQGYKGYFHCYDSTGKWLKSFGWKEAKDAALDVLVSEVKSQGSDVVFFRVVLGTLDNADLAPADFPADGLLLTLGAEQPDTPVVPEQPDVPAGELVYPTLVQGTVDGNTGEIMGHVTTRLSTEELIPVANYEKVTIAQGYKGYFHCYDSTGKWLKSFGWKEAKDAALDVLVSEVKSQGSDVVFFRVVLGTLDNADLAPADFPADGLALTPAAEQPDTPVVPEEPEQPEEPEEPVLPDGDMLYPTLVQGTVDGNTGEIMGHVTTRLSTEELIAIDDCESVVIAKGYKGYFHCYDADGNWKKSFGWKEAKDTTLVLPIADIKKEAGDYPFYRVVIGTLDNADLKVEDFPADGLAIELVPAAEYPEFTQGTIDKDAIHTHVDTRFHTAELLNVTDYKKITVAKGYKIYLHFYDAEGKWVSGAGWKEAKDADLEITGVKIQKDAGTSPKMRIVVSTLNNDALTPETLPKNVVALTMAPAPVTPTVAIGTVDKGTIYAHVNTRAHATELFALKDFEKVIIADGYKAAYHFYDAEGKWLNNKAWLSTITMGELKKHANEGATQLQIVIAKSDDSALTLEAIPADVIQLIKVGAYGACAEHEVKEYISNNDATCTEDGTKTGTCTVCGEPVTVKDEYSAKGHQFAEGAETCGTCGAARPDAATCEHKFGKYTSNNDATCDENGTKSATCLLCGQVNTVEDENTALGHVAEYTPNNDASCDKNATETGLCTRCNKEVTRDIPGSMLGHKFNSDADDNCSVCGFERTRLVYYVYEGRLGGVDANDGLTAETPVATIENAIKLALEKGAGIGDIVELKISGTVAWGGTVDGNWENIVEYGFKLILSAQDSTATVGDGQKNIILGGAVVYDGVILNAGNNWRAFCANGKDFTFGKGFASDMFDLALGNRKNIDVNKDVTYNFDAFFPKIWVGNNYHSVNYNKKFTLNLNGNLRADGSEDTRNFTLVLGAGENGKTNFNGIATITNNTNNGLTFKDGGKVIVGENGAFILINKNADLPVSITEIGLTEEAVAKTWVLNVAAMATIDPTDVAGEFDVAMGYIATATPVEGEAIKSVGGKLVIPAGEYTISFEICQAHAYDNDYDPDCNVCGAVREVEEPDCIHEWSEYVADGAADCENNATETRTCALCGETETREVPDTMLGHNYDDNGFCTGCGIYEVLDPTLVKIDGVWYYLEDGVKTNKTTLVKYSGKWFYLENGIWDAKITNTLVKYEGKWFYIKGGKWDSKVEDLVKYSGKWFYIKSGKWNSSSKTLFKKNGSWFYINNGKWDSSAKCIFKFNGKDFYISGGKWKSTTNTLFKKDGKYYAIKSGKWYKGKNIIKYNGKKYYVNDGYAQTKYSGKVTISGKKYTVKKGIIQ